MSKYVYLVFNKPVINAKELWTSLCCNAFRLNSDNNIFNLVNSLHMRYRWFSSDVTAAIFVSQMNSMGLQGEVIRATNCCNLQRNIVALQVEKCCWPYYCTHLKNCHATKFVVASWKNLLKKVDASSTWCNMLLQLVGGKCCQWRRKMLKKIVEEKWRKMLKKNVARKCRLEEKCCQCYRAFSLFLFKHFVLFPHSNMAAGHVSENHPLYNYLIINPQ